MAEKINVYDAPAEKFNEKLAEALLDIEEFKMPEWAAYVKTSAGKARPPFEQSWWYKRAAGILRHIDRKGVIGVNKLKTKYSVRKKRGSKPEEFREGSGKIIRVILQQGEKAGFLAKAEGKKKGRKLTKKGLEFLNNLAEKIKSETGEK